MILSEIQNKIAIALLCFLSKDANLLDYAIKPLPERAITHRLGLNLQFLFDKLDVDCEYNRHLGDDSKRGGMDVMTPDIVIHNRKNDSDNLLVVELKADTDQKEINEDYRKLCKFTKIDNMPHYKYGLFILFQPDQISLEWFREGTRMSDQRVWTLSTNFKFYEYKKSLS